MAYKIRKMDRTGHSELVCKTAAEAVHEVNSHLKEGGFALVGDNLFHTGTVNAQDLEGVQDIFLSQKIAGG